MADQVYALSTPHVKGTRMHVERSQRDVGLLINYLDDKIDKVKAFGTFRTQPGLQYPLLDPKLSHDDCLQLEQQLKLKFMAQMKVV